mgnify:CR=1 FL=1
MSDSIIQGRRKFVTVRVTTEEKTEIEEIAKLNKKDVSSYLRELVLAESAKSKKWVDTQAKGI